MIESQPQISTYKSILARIFSLLLILVPASFPFNTKTSSQLTALLVIAWLLSLNYKRLVQTVKNKYFLLFISVFILPALSLLYSTDKDFSLLEKRLFLLVYPLVLFTSQITHNQLRSILYGFVVSSAVAISYVLVLATYHHQPMDTEMTKTHLGISHVYFGLYLSFSIVVLSYFLITDRARKYVSLLSIFLILYFLFFLFMLGGKMSIISLFLLIILGGINIIIKTKRWIIGAVIFFLPVLIFALTIKHFDVTYYRFYDLFDSNNYFVGDNAWNSIGSRISILKCTFEIYREAPILGTGIGDVQADLDSCYSHSDFTTLWGLNTHNQYLQFLLGTGIVSLIIFLIVFYIPLRQAYKKRNILYVSFTFLFLVCCMTEAILERQYGTMFYGFFNSILFLISFDGNAEKSAKIVN